MKVLISLTLLSAIAYGAIPQERVLFNQFKIDYGKTYENPAEEEMRFNIFTQNYRKIVEHNLSGQTWTEAINQFADLTQDEFKKLMGYQKKSFSKSTSIPVSDIDISQLPKSVDWRKKGAISPIKNQGNCGSCWAFATAEAVESYSFLNNKTLPILSPQQLVSCTSAWLGGGGCNGNIPELAYTFTNLEGIVTEKEIPYTSGTSGDGGKCTYNPKKTPPVATVRGYEDLPINNYAAVMNHLATIGPLTIGADGQPMQFYNKGIFDGCSIKKDIILDHAIQLVGYGTDPKDGDFWIVRNSWGTTWGEDGYIRLRRHTPPYCGHDGTSKVCGTCGILAAPSYPLGASLLPKN